ncbi:antigen WC1.1-like [Aythya fuligula]|uniref:Antigen WC1.1-like n=1 Tax=Aythya fuligula TaxID=219594 RepID=A0A6J3EBA4_AYTFU|nr:antigen WC1.1-like [Aythya fuligula]
MRWEVGTEVPEGSGNSQVSLVAPGFVRLVGGDSPCSGSVEVYNRDQWKAVCPSHFGAKAAEVVCRELQCGTALSVHGAAQLGEGAGPVWDRELQCVGNESTILFCPWGAPKDKACTQSNGTHVTCTRFRLVNGSTACEGRVEVDVLGMWGTLCASRWDLSDAHVLCRHLGCGFAESIPGGGHFGRGTGPFWRDSFHCDGTEAHLGQCPVTALGASPCSQENAAAVICSGPAHHMSVWLVGGGSQCNGRVEVFQHGTWGRVLDEQCDMQEASVVCRQLQCGEAEAAYTPVRAERGPGPVGLRGVWCAGHKADLSLCNTSLPESHPAIGIAEDVGVRSRRVRLVDGAGRCAGRVEIYYQGRWGTVCDDAWDLADAAIICRQLGCGGALEAAGSARFGEGSGQIWLDGVNCSGAEAALWDCPAEAWGQHDCRHKEDAGVICSGRPWGLSSFMALRLENSDGCSRRLQVLYNGTWGSVCSNSMTTEMVSLVCKELGCGNEGDREIFLNYAKLSGTAWLDHVECGKSNSSFWQCPSHPWNPQSCDDLREETHITCNGAAEVRLADGGSRCAGRVEVKHQGQWGTVCHFSWDMTDAAVVCRQLGCGVALKAPQYAHFGPGSGRIWMSYVGCRGTESALSDCTHAGWGPTNCIHSWDAGVTCSGFVRLVGGDSPCSGSVEVYDRDQWKAVCHSHFGAKAAEVVCRELQCGTALSVRGAAHVGEGARPVWDRDLQCVGNESVLSFCPTEAPKDKACTQSNGTHVTCTRFRLVNGSTACEGRVEVEVLGTWGTLCASRWDLSDAHVLCRHLGCGFTESIPGGGHFGRGTGPVWRDSFHCDGTEAHVGQCAVTALGASPCSQENAAAVICSGHEANLSLCNTSLPESTPAEGIMEDVGVVCRGSRRVRLADGAGRCAGRVEIYYQGRWGTVCDDAWDLADAAVVCRQLGCGGALEAAGSARFGEGSGQIWLDGVNCSGAEAALWDCPAEAWGQHDCRHKEDAGVICSEFMALRLENSDGCSGRLQVFYNGTWGSVCSNSITTETVSLVCKELGCGNEGELVTDSSYAELSGTAWLDRVECGKRKSSFWQCPSASWHPQSCTDRREEANITCKGKSEPSRHQVLLPTGHGEMQRRNPERL